MPANGDPGPNGSKYAAMCSRASIEMPGTSARAACSSIPNAATVYACPEMAIPAASRYRVPAAAPQYRTGFLTGARHVETCARMFAVSISAAGSASVARFVAKFSPARHLQTSQFVRFRRAHPIPAISSTPKRHP